MKLAQRILRFIDPSKEEERRDFRQCVAATQAHAMDVDRTISMSRDEFYKQQEKPAVIFATFSDTCTYRVPGITPRLCRHEKHPERIETSLAICDEDKCPFMRGLA